MMKKLPDELVAKLPRSLPNLLTYGRIAVIPIIVVLILLDCGFGRWAAFLLFLLAAVTDYYDGLLARQMKVVSPVGVFLDPIADKLLVTAVILALASTGQIGGWDLLPATVILCREILISGLREYLAGAGVKVPVTALAKYKTTAQLAALAIVILGARGGGLADLGLVGLWIAALLTAATGWTYLKRGLRHMTASDRP